MADVEVLGGEVQKAWRHLHQEWYRPQGLASGKRRGLRASTMGSASNMGNPSLPCFFVGLSLTLINLIIYIHVLFIAEVIWGIWTFILSLISNFMAWGSENTACDSCSGEFVVIHVWKEFYRQSVGYESISS